MPAKKAEEKRKHLRFPVALPVDFGSGDYYLSSICSNLSERGIFVETSNSFQIGERVCIFLSLPHQPDPIKVVGEVMWVQQGTAKDMQGNDVRGVGMKFIGLYPEGEELLDGFLSGSWMENKYFFDEEGRDRQVF